MIITFAGLSGSGKSFTAKKLNEILKCPYLNSDVIRKNLANINVHKKVLDDFGKGLYSKNVSIKTYEELLKNAIKISREKGLVIIDATFSSEKYQQMLLNCGEDFIFIYCFADDDVIKDRLEKRIKDKNEVSDGRWEIYLKQKENFNGFIIPEEKILKVNTGDRTYFEKVLDFVKKNISSQ
jgi:predicted kinase